MFVFPSFQLNYLLQECAYVVRTEPIIKTCFRPHLLNTDVQNLLYALDMIASAIKRSDIL